MYKEEPMLSEETKVSLFLDLKEEPREAARQEYLRTIPLVPLQDTSASCCKEPSKKKEKEKKMRTNYYDSSYESTTVHVAAPPSDDAKARAHLMDRLYQVESDKRNDLIKHFHLLADEAPQTLDEALERIKNGAFRAPSKEAQKEKRGYTSWYRMIEWRTQDADHDGYDKAVAALNQARRDAEDIIQALSPADGLKALNDFKAKTFH